MQTFGGGKKEGTRGDAIVIIKREQLEGGVGGGPVVTRKNPNNERAIVTFGGRSNDAPTRRPNKRGEPGLIAAVAQSMVADVLTTQAGEGTTLADRLMGSAMKKLQTFNARLGLPGKVKPPLSQNIDAVAGCMVRAVNRAAQVDNRSVLGVSNIQATIDERLTPALKALDQIPPSDSLNEDERKLAEVRALAVAGGDTVQNSRQAIVDHSRERLRDQVAAEVNAALARNNGELANRIEAALRKSPDTVFAMDPLSGSIVLNRDERKKMGDVAWTFDLRGITLRVYRKQDIKKVGPGTPPKVDEITIPWQSIDLGKNDRLAAQAQREPEYRVKIRRPKYVAAFEKAWWPFNLLLRAGKAAKLAGVLDIETSLPESELPTGWGPNDMPDLVVRSPDVVVGKLIEVKNAAHAAKQTISQVDQTLQNPEPNIPRVIHPNSVELASLRQARQQLLDRLEPMNARFAEIKRMNPSDLTPALKEEGRRLLLHGRAGVAQFDEVERRIKELENTGYSHE